MFVVAQIALAKRPDDVYENDQTMRQQLSVFTRKLGTCPHDDVLPTGPKGAAAFLINYNEAFMFTENGVQHYGIRDPDFSQCIENTNKTAGEPKYYHFQSGFSNEPYKDEIYTYRSAIVPNPVPVDQFTQIMKTIFYGIKWETWQAQQPIIRAAIERELGGVYEKTLGKLKEKYYELLDGMNGIFILDQHDYRPIEELEEEDD